MISAELLLFCLEEGHAQLGASCGIAVHVALFFQPLQKFLAACGGVPDGVAGVDHRVAERRAHRHRPRQRHRHEGEVHAVDPAQATERLDRSQMSMSAEGKEERGRPVWRSGDGEQMGGVTSAGNRGEMLMR